MSDTWSDIQAIKEKQLSLREKLQRRKKEREGLVAGITGDVATVVSSSTTGTGVATSSTPRSLSPAPGQVPTQICKAETHVVKVDKELVASVEKLLVLYLCDVTLEFPVDASVLHNYVKRNSHKDVAVSVVEDLLQKLAAQQMISISKQDSDGTSQSGTYLVKSTDHSKLSAMANELGGPKSEVVKSRKRKPDSESDGTEEPPSKSANKMSQKDSNPPGDSIESLLSMQSAKERENKKVHEEILQLLSKPTAKEQSIVENFRSQGGAQVQEFCQFGTKEECFRSSENHRACTKLHFKKIIHKHTDESLGDCSFLNTCFHMDTCKYVHYEIDYPENVPMTKPDMAVMKKNKDNSTILYPPQWIQCDVRCLDMSILGKFSVIMADPPWDIHMELPYGTMSDDEMRKLAVPSLQDDGFIFLWVTGRAMELGRECLKLWGYERIDELIWVKTNQLQRIIRTGRTGHWLNHGKEHCLVGVKGNPKNVNKGLDCDVIVAEVRATSHKPDEIYGIIERLAPGTRKIELFGRPHNVQPNWVTLGNQLDGVRLLDPEIVNNFKKLYPDGNCMKPPGT